MRRLGLAVKALLLGLVFSGIFLYTLLVTLPVSWWVWSAQEGRLAQWLPSEWQPGLQVVPWQRLEGHLLKGRLQPGITQGVAHESVEWQVFWSVWRPGLRLHLGETEAAWSLALRPTFSGLDVEMQAGALSLLPLEAWSLSLSGELTGRLHARLQRQAGDWQCRQMSGAWQGSVQLEAPLSLHLGDLDLQPACEAEELFAQLRIQASRQHDLALSFSLNPQGWTFEGQAQVSDEAPLLAWLQMAQWRDRGALEGGELVPGRRLSANNRGPLSF